MLTETDNKNIRKMIKEETADMRQDISVLKEDVAVLKEDVCFLKKDVGYLKDEAKTYDSRMEAIASKYLGIYIEETRKLMVEAGLIAKDYAPKIAKAEHNIHNLTTLTTVHGLAIKNHDNRIVVLEKSNI